MDNCVGLRHTNAIHKNRRRLLASALIKAILVGSLLINTQFASRQALAFDPATVGIAISVTQSVLSMTDKKHDVNGVVLQQTFQLVEALHDRMDAMEGALITLLKLVERLPAVMRAEVERGGRLQRLRTVLGQIKSVQNLLQAVEQDPNRKDLPKWAAFEVKIADLEADRTSLMAESDLIVPVLVAAMVAEIQVYRFLDALPPIENITRSPKLPKVLQAYETRLSQSLDPSNPDSLAALRAQLEADQIKDENQIATELGLTDVVTTGRVGWFAVVEHKTRPITKVRCKRRRIKAIDGWEDECPKQHVRVEHYDHNTRTWSRDVTVTPLRGHETSGLKTISVAAFGPTVTSGDLANVPHGTSAADLEAPYTTTLSNGGTFFNKLEVFNKRAEAIADLRNLEQMASSALTMTSSMDGRVLEKLTATAETYGGDEIDINAHERLMRNQDVQQNIVEMEKAKKHADSVRKNAQEAIDKEVKTAESEKWRGDLMMALQITQTAVQFHELWTKVSASLQDAVDATKIGAGNSAVKKLGDNAPTGRQNEKDDQVSNKTATEPENLPLVDRRHPSNVKDRARIEDILREVKSHPFDPNMPLPDQLTREETLLLEGMSRINRWSATAADAFHDKHKIDPAEVAKDFVVSSLSGDLQERVGTAISAIHPDVVADGTLDSIQYRNQLYKELEAQYKQYFNRRFGLVLDVAAARKLVQPDDCWEKQCLRAKKP